MSYGFKDSSIPARTAMIVWNPGPNKGGDGRVKVIEHPQERDSPYADLDCSAGACDAGWEDASDEVMLTKIEAMAWHITHRYEVSPAAIHAALMEIDLYAAFWTRTSGIEGPP